MSKLFFKVAAEPWEIEQIHQINYQAFVEEIPQHTPNPERRLVDKFHEQNTYIIGLDGTQVVAMVALRDQRPFSLDQKLENLDAYLPPAKRLGEIRLLYILPAYRNATTFRDLLDAAAIEGMRRDWDLAVISGTTRQQRLYKHLGFLPFGPLVGNPGAQFQPMYWTLAAFQARLHWLQVLQGASESVVSESVSEPVNG